MTQEEINSLIKKLLKELNNGLYEKERSIRLNLLAILAGESTFMLGEPGTAKSLIARRISEAFEDVNNDDEIKFFDYLMNQFSTPEEIFGPVSIQELKNDKYVRKTEKYLPQAQFAFLDEIWKANPAIQNALLTILNEKIYRNGTKTEKVPLIGFMSASNELPEKGKGLEAIFDRFLIRIMERPIADNENFRKMISSKRTTTTNISEKLSRNVINIILKESETIKISDDCYNIIDTIRKVLTKRNSEIQDENEKYLISDRRWKKIANLMRVSAYCNNRNETDIMDATLIANCLWSTETQENDVRVIINEIIEDYCIKCSTDLLMHEKNLMDYTKKIEQTFYKEVSHGGEIRTKIIDGIKFYIVRDKKGNEHRISEKPCAEFTTYIRNDYENNYYFENDRNRIFGKYINDKFISDDGYTKGVYTIERTPKTTTLIRDTLFGTKNNEGEIIIKNFNTNYYQPILNKLETDLNYIDKQLNDSNEKYGNNMFVDINYYLPIINAKLIETKVKLNDFIAKLKAQKERYDIY